MTSLKGIALHTIDLIQYITTGRNVGLYGTSEFTERSGPLKLTEKSDTIHLEHGIEAERQLRRMKAIQAVEAKRVARIAAFEARKGLPTHPPADAGSKGAALMRKQRKKLASVAAPTPATDETYISGIIQIIKEAYAKLLSQNPTAENNPSSKSDSKETPKRGRSK